MKVTGCGITQGGEGRLLGRKRVGGLGRCAISVKLQLTGWQGRGCAIIHNFSEFEISCQTICTEKFPDDFFSSSYFSEQELPILWLKAVVRCKHKISN